ncbi:hypothetical protein DIPPA_12073 [Diplonema papillatum]|nr:hypothetical protein DIPPA_12073 [Diplonema papillatum]
MTRSGWKTVGSPGRKPPHVSEGRKAAAAQSTASKPMASKAVTTAQQEQGPGEATSSRAATAAQQRAGGRAPLPQEDRRGTESKHFLKSSPRP